MNQVVQRHIDIETFKPEPYWVLELGILKRGRRLRALWESGRSFNKKKTESLVQKALEGNVVAVVKNVVIKEKKQGRPVRKFCIERRTKHRFSPISVMLGQLTPLLSLLSLLQIGFSPQYCCLAQSLFQGSWNWSTPSHAICRATIFVRISELSKNRVHCIPRIVRHQRDLTGTGRGFPLGTVCA